MDREKLKQRIEDIIESHDDLVYQLGMQCDETSSDVAEKILQEIEKYG